MNDPTRRVGSKRLDPKVVCILDLSAFFFVYVRDYWILIVLKHSLPYKQMFQEVLFFLV